MAENMLQENYKCQILPGKTLQDTLISWGVLRTPWKTSVTVPLFLQMENLALGTIIAGRKNYV